VNGCVILGIVVVIFEDMMENEIPDEVVNNEEVADCEYALFKGTVNFEAEREEDCNVIVDDADAGGGLFFDKPVHDFLKEDKKIIFNIFRL